MNISAISPVNIGKINNFKGNIIQFPPPDNNPNKNFSQKSPVNSSYFKSLYGIEAPELKLSATLPDKTKYDIYLDEETIADYLTDKKGNIIPANLKLFTYFQAQIADCIMKDREFSGKDIPEVATDRTTNFFRMSKWKGGYDFTDFNKKYQVIKQVELIKKDHAFDVEDDETIFFEIVKASKGTDGKLNYDLIHQALDILQKNNAVQPIGKTIELLKYYYSLDYDKKDEIYDTIYQLNQTYFSIGRDDEVFETVMDVCFDENKKYSQKRADTLFQCIDEIEKWISKKMCSREYEKDPAGQMEKYIETALTLITDYFVGFEETKEPSQYFAETLSNLLIF